MTTYHISRFSDPDSAAAEGLKDVQTPTWCTMPQPEPGLYCRAETRTPFQRGSKTRERHERHDACWLAVYSTGRIASTRISWQSQPLPVPRRRAQAAIMRRLFKALGSPDFRSDGCRLRIGTHSGVAPTAAAASRSCHRLDPPAEKNDASAEPECAIVARFSAHAAFPAALVHVAASTRISGSLGGLEGRRAVFHERWLIRRWISSRFTSFLLSHQQTISHRSPLLFIEIYVPTMRYR